MSGQRELGRAVRQTLQTVGRELFEHGWAASALLLLFLSLIPVLLPMSDAIPELALPASSAAPAKAHSRVVLLIVDGLGYGKALQSGWMPRLQARLPGAASGAALASFPTITPTGLRGIMSGHRMVSEPQMPTGLQTPAESDSVLARAAAAGLKAFVIGQFTWPPIFPGGHGAELTVIPYDGVRLREDHGRRENAVNYDEAVLAAGAPIINGERGAWDLLVLHLFEADSLGHAVGTEDALYRAHLNWLDRRIDEMARAMRAPTTFLLVGDHGQAPDGTHGGLSDLDRRVPFVLWGALVKPGPLADRPLYDAAPTLSALLGVPPPALSEGRPALEALAFTDRQSAEALRDLAAQRIGRWSTVKAAFPWAVGEPRARQAEVERLYRAGNFAAAADSAERLVSFLDRAIDDALPGKWLWRLVAGLWCVVLSSTFGLAWPRASANTGRLAAALCAACLGLLAFPLLRPSFWAWDSALLLGGCAGLLLLTLAPGFNRDSGLDWFGWALWWFALFGLAFGELVDRLLWSWLVLGGLFASRAWRMTRDNAVTSLVSFFFAACAATLTAGPSGDYSLLRSLLPAAPRLFAVVPWGPAALLMLGVLAGGAGAAFGARRERRHTWTACALALAPLVAAFALGRWSPGQAAWAWGACAASLIGVVSLMPEARIRGMWMSLLALAFYRTMAGDRQWCLLALASAVGWSLAWNTRDAHPLWEGLGLLGVGLWGLRLTGGTLSFSHITVAEGSRLLGNGWHPYALLALLTLKPLAAFGAPILPRLAVRPLYSALGILPLLGALTAGNLTMIWWSRFMLAGSQRLTDDAGFAQSLFVLVLAWIVLGLWASARGLDALSRRLHRA